MNMRTTVLSVLLALTATGVQAQTPPPQDVAWPGVLRIEVDARDIGRRIFKVKATIPAKPGPLTLLYPQWLPGAHSPSGPIDKVAGWWSPPTASRCNGRAISTTCTPSR